MDLGIGLPSVMDRRSPPGPTRLAAQESRTGAGAEAPDHIVPRKLDRSKPAFLADKATGVLVDGSGFGSAFCSHLLSDALARSPGLRLDLV